MYLFKIHHFYQPWLSQILISDSTRLCYMWLFSSLWSTILPMNPWKKTPQLYYIFGFPTEVGSILAQGTFVAILAHIESRIVLVDFLKSETLRYLISYYICSDWQCTLIMMIVGQSQLPISRRNMTNHTCKLLEISSFVGITHSRSYTKINSEESSARKGSNSSEHQNRQLYRKQQTINIFKT